MKMWQYERGNQWTEIDVPLQDETETDWNKMLTGIGYRHHCFFGDKDQEHLDVWRKESSNIVYLTLEVNSFEVVFCPAPPDYLAFLKEYGLPLLREVLQLYRDAAYEKTLARAFEAWHGHSPENACAHCDSEEMYFRKLRAEARKEKKE